MTTQTLVTCNGKINQHGFCDKCYQPAHTTSNQCGRLVPYQQAEINTVLAGSGQCCKCISGSLLLHDILQVGNFKNEDGMPVVKMVDKPNGGSVAYIRHDAMVKKLNSIMAACASGALDTVAEAGVDKWCDSCEKVTRWINNECINYTKQKRKSSEGQP